jgi:predicted RNA-binding protein with PIN domain
VQREDISEKFCIRYPLPGSSADDEIKQILNGFQYFKDVIVVTSDRDLRTFAKKKGAKIINSIEFYFELKRVSRIHGKKEETKKRIDTQLSDTEVEQWMKIFER